MARSSSGSNEARPVRFEVRNLFSRFTWSISLPTQNEPVRFLSAPNGYGKSTMLRILDDIAQQRWTSLIRTFFDSATLSFENGAELTLSREGAAEDERYLTITLARPDADAVRNEVRPTTAKPNLETEIPPWIRQVGIDRFRDMRYGETMSADELIHVLGRKAEKRTTPPQLDDAIEQVLSGLEVQYLDANRLSTNIRTETRRLTYPSSRKPDRLAAIQYISDVIEDVLRRSRFQSARASERAQGSFPARVLQALRGPASRQSGTGASLEERYASLRVKEQQFRDLALTDDAMEEIPSEDLTRQGPVAVVLDQMIMGIEKRFSSLEKTARQLTLFRDTVNGMLEDKSVRFVFKQTVTGRGRGGLEVLDDVGRSIPLTALSSGEQHLIVMFGHILFTSRLSEGGLVLLDEPEISLHPQWQIAVIEALRKVAAINECRMLLATHSPVMIGDDWSAEISLSR